MMRAETEVGDLMEKLSNGVTNSWKFATQALIAQSHHPFCLNSIQSNLILPADVAYQTHPYNGFNQIAIRQKVSAYCHVGKNQVSCR